MKKYYYFVDEWKGPFTITELLKEETNLDTPVWYPELCENGMTNPNDCNHPKSNIERLTKKNANNMQKKLIRNLILTKAPLKGYFRYKNEFQIFPATYKNIPQNSHATHFPIIIEYWIDESDKPNIPEDLKDIENFLSRNTIIMNKLRSLCSLLSVITNHRFFTYNMEGQWFMNIPDGEITDEVNKQSSTWGISAYIYPELGKDMIIDKFTQTDFEQIKPVEHFKYFLHDPIESHLNEITFPQTIYLILGGFFGLDKKERKAAEAAAHLICNGIDIQTSMKSLSFLSFISSIETIVNLEYTDKNKGIKFECNDCKTISEAPYKCHKCNRPIWGIAAKFREFLAEFIHNSEGSIKKYKKIYNLRSKLVHDGSLLLGDNYTDWGDVNNPNSHWLLHLETMQLSKLTLTNWLVHKRNMKLRENKK